MAFVRKAANLLGAASNQISQEISLTRPSILQAIGCMYTSKLLIKGLSPDTDDASLKDVFSKYGQVSEARVIVKRCNGKSRDEAAAAVEALHNEDLHGQRIKVDYANHRVCANEGEGGGSVGSYVSSGDQKSGGGGGGKAATASVEIPGEQEYYARKASGVGHIGGMMEVIFYASSYYEDP